MKRIEEDTIRKILYKNHGVDGYTLFYEVEPEARDKIIADVFLSLTNYRLRKGLGLYENVDKEPDTFDGYKNFKHLHSIDGLTFDINQTLKASRSRKGRKRRKEFQKKKASYLKKKQRQLSELNKEDHLQKWSPGDSEKKKRLQQIRAKKRAINRDEFER